MTFRAPIGQSDFERVRRGGYQYVDKTRFVARVVDSPEPALLLPRPRRFGKTLNMTTLRYWFERSDHNRDALFDGLEIWRLGEPYRAHYQRHPVIHLTFKDIQEPTWPEAIGGLLETVRDELERHRPIYEVALTETDRAWLGRVLGEGAAAKDLSRALGKLSAWLHRATGEEVVILIDEYDSPIHAAFRHGYYEDAVTFFRNFLSAGLKDNLHLYRGVLTGILRVAKEGIFSSLNNVAVYSLLDSEFSTDFGFTDDEVTELTKAAGLVADREEIREWYDGYLFGGHVIYNPWSVLTYLRRPADGFQPYWSNTSSNELIRDLLTRSPASVQDGIEVLVTGGEIIRPVRQDIVLREVRHEADELWSFLVFSGYLKAGSPRGPRSGGSPLRPLSIPNREVAAVYERTFVGWLNKASGGHAKLHELTASLFAGDAAGLARRIENLLRDCLSYHDVAGRRPEAVYQAFVIGLLAHLTNEYDVTSNREEGHGRYDILVAPRTPGRPGAVLELKVVDADDDAALDRALEEAARQLVTRDYAAGLRRRGADPLVQVALVFDGKRARARLV